MYCLRCLVSGKVQGVWFRETTRRKATQWHVQGEALNLSDGRVEVVLCGSKEAVESMREWLWTGSPLSRVEAVDCQRIEPEVEYQDFRIGWG